MNKRKMLFQVLAVMSSISGTSYDLDDIIIGSDEKIMNYSVRLLCEILDLLEEGYTEEDIIEMINNCEFKNETNLNNEEKEYLKKNAKKTLKKVLNNRKGE